MAQRGLKLIQNGQVSYVPYNKEVLRHWQDYNTALNRPPKSKAMEQNLVTILDASAEEVELYLHPKPKPRIPLPGVPGLPTMADENKQLKAELSELKTMMLKFMAGGQGKGVEVEEEFADVFGKETKRGRKSKTA